MIIVALVVGAAAQLIRNLWDIPGPRTRFDWLIVAVVAFVFGIGISVVRQLGPEWDGLYVVPAILGAVVWGAVAAAVLRYVGRSRPEEE
jgi:hypothetical protein